MKSSNCTGVPRRLVVALVLLSIVMVLTGCIAPVAAIPVVATEHDAKEHDASEPAAVAAEVDKVANAMSAAPASIAENATIVDWPTEAGGELAELRAGTNGWVCLPDWQVTPTNDPMCLDAVWQGWFSAFASGTEPQITELGVAYMLMGASNGSNVDPFATEPPPGEEWIIDPPHLMLLLPGGFDPQHYSTDHHSGGPYVMWEGTPYEHMMVPITDHSDQK